MGKIKNALIEYELQTKKKSPLDNLDPRLSGLEDTDEALAQYHKEFNDWLDFFEAKYSGDLGNTGDNHD